MNKKIINRSWLVDIVSYCYAINYVHLRNFCFWIWPLSHWLHNFMKHTLFDLSIFNCFLIIWNCKYWIFFSKYVTIEAILHVIDKFYLYYSSIILFQKLITKVVTRQRTRKVVIFLKNPNNFCFLSYYHIFPNLKSIKTFLSVQCNIEFLALFFYYWLMVHSSTIKLSLSTSDDLIRRTIHKR